MGCHMNSIKSDDVLKDLVPQKYELRSSGDGPMNVWGPGNRWGEFVWNNGVGTVDVSGNTNSFAVENDTFGIAGTIPSGEFSFIIYVKPVATPRSAPRRLAVPRMGKLGLGLSYSAATKSLDDIKSVSEDNDVVVVAKTSGMTVMTINDLSFENSDEAVITLSKDNNFAEVINDLKAYASPDTPYYYTIVEYMINGQKVDAAGYVDSYKVTDGDSETHYSINAASGGNASVEITNTKKPTESVGLPETGGSGTAPYTAAGIAIMALSGTVLFFKRRSRCERKRA